MIIGLSGQAGSGKDTVADFLVEHYGFVKVALADPIKRAAMEWWGFTEEQLWGPSSERNKPDMRYLVEPSNPFGAPVDVYLTPRHALQKIGTEVGRAIDPDVWVRLTMRIARRLLAKEGDREYERTVGMYITRGSTGPYRGVVISDCRFRNEFKVIKENGYLVRIKRPQAGLEGEKAQHASEAEQREVPDDYFDYVMHNEGSSLHNLKLHVDSMMDAIQGRMKQYDANGDDDIPPFKRT